MQHERRLRVVAGPTLVGALLALLSGAGCGDSLTQVVIVVETDLSVPDELDVVELLVEGPGGRTATRSASLAGPGAARFPIELGVVSDHGLLPLTVTVTGRLTGRLLVERRVETGFVQGQTRMLRVPLLRACVGVACDDELTCGESGCEAADRPPAELEPWTGPPPDLDAGPRPDARPPILAQALAAGAQHACLVDDLGSVYCWGLNREGQVGDGSTAALRRFPVRVGGLPAAAQVAAGDGHSCVRTIDGEVWCWGRGTGGELGTGTAMSSPVPAQVPGLISVTALAVGAGHGCAIAAGQVQCWGRNDQGQVGRTDPDVVPSPVLVAGVSGAVAIAAGRGHSCAATATDVLCWGANESGQLGVGSTTPSVTPQPVTGPVVASRLAAGARHSCAIDATQGLLCWGANESGQLGVGRPPDRALEPAPVTLADVTTVNAGDGHSCAATSTGALLCFGRNDLGQLGDGTTETRTQPTPVESISNVLEVVTGVAFTCARRLAGPVACWGDNSSGQLGDGEPSSSRPTPGSILTPLQ